MSNLTDWKKMIMSRYPKAKIRHDEDTLKYKAYLNDKVIATYNFSKKDNLPLIKPSLKEDISRNAGVKYIAECVKIKEMEAMSKAYSVFANFARDLASLKSIYQPVQSGLPMYSMMGGDRDKLSSEDQEVIRKKLYGFSINRLEMIKDIIEDTLGKKEDDDDESEGVKVVISRSE